MNQTVQQNLKINLLVKQKYPTGFYILLFAEVWERFSFYGVRALLTLYMARQLLLSDSHIFGIYGAYGAMIYSTTILGGYIADKYTGGKFATLYGGVLIVIGHIVMILQKLFAVSLQETCFLTGLSFIILGTSFFKGNVAALIGNINKKYNLCQDSGFTLLHMGVNIGSCTAPLICGYVGEKIGWHYGFGLAGLGMMLGLLVLHFGRHHLVDSDDQNTRLSDKRNKGKIGTIIFSLSLVPLLLYCLNHYHVSTYILNVIGVLTFGYLIYNVKHASVEERKSMLTIMAIFPFLTVFFACFEQCGGIMNIFTDRHIDRQFFNFQVPSSWFLSLNPLMIIILAPLFAKLWNWLRIKRRNPADPIKIALGLLQVGLGFACLFIAIQNFQDSGMVAMIWIVLAYFFHTTGELCLTPVTLAMISKLAPKRLLSFMMSCFYLSVAFAHLVGAGIAKAVTHVNDGVSLDHIQSMLGFAEAFRIFFIFPMVAAVMLFVLTKTYQKFTGERM